MEQNVQHLKQRIILKERDKLMAEDALHKERKNIISSQSYLHKCLLKVNDKFIPLKKRTEIREEYSMNTIRKTEEEVDLLTGVITNIQEETAINEEDNLKIQNKINEIVDRRIENENKMKELESLLAREKKMSEEINQCIDSQKNTIKMLACENWCLNAEISKASQQKARKKRRSLKRALLSIFGISRPSD